MNKTCIECKKTFAATRSHAKTCSTICRNKNSKRTRSEEKLKLEEEERENKKIAQLQQKIEQLEKQNLISKSIIEEQASLRLELPHKIDQLQNELSNIIKQIQRLNRKYNTDLEKFYYQYIKKDSYQPYYNSFYHSPPKLYGLTKDKATKLVADEKEKILLQIRVLNQQEIRLKNEISNLEGKRQLANSKITSETKAITFNQERILQLDEVFNNFFHFGSRKQHKTSTKPSQKRLKSEVTGTELLNMHFETFALNGEIGQFIGDLERYKLAIALTGDSGAGKTHFSFQLASLFLYNGFSVKYYSLEMGLSGKIKELIQEYKCDTIHITEKGKINDIKRDAKLFDVLIVDSFGKIEAHPKDFDSLRLEFPNTIFIFIFQKTNSGTMRGGASIKFDSSMNINVIKRENLRIAVMEKSRYGTIGWEYCISTDEIIKRND